MNAELLRWIARAIVFALVIVGIAAGAEAQSVPRCTLAETLRIGAVDGPSAFSAISAVLPALDGRRVFIAESRDYEIRIVDSSTGRLVRSFGSRGQGPGEFQSISNLSWRLDTLVVADKFQQRLALFTTAGDHLESLRIVASSPDHPTPVVGVALDPAGGVWSEPVIDMLRVPRLGTAGSPVVRLSRTGEHQERIGLLRLSGTMRVVDYRSGVAVFVQPLSRWHLRAFSPDGEAVVFVSMPEPSGSTAQFEVVKIAFTGDTLYRRSFSYAPRPITSQARDSIWLAYSPNFGRGNAPSAAEELAREHVTIPRTQPPVSHVFIGTAGEVWLRREEVTDSHAWITLDTTGRIKHACQAPPGVRVLAAGESFAWGEWKDDLDIPYLVRLAIRPSS